MIDEEIFIEWFKNQSYWHISCDCDNGQYYCNIKKCINDFKEDNTFRIETEAIIYGILAKNTNEHLKLKKSFKAITSEIFEKLKEEKVFE